MILFAAIRQLHPSPNILSIARRFQSRMKQRSERSRNTYIIRALHEYEKIDRSDDGGTSLLRKPQKTCPKKTPRGAENLLEALMVPTMTCLFLFHLCPATGFPAVHSLLSILLSIEWKRFCWLYLAAPPTVVFKELPLSFCLPRAGFLFPLIFSSASSASLSAPLGSTYDNFLFLQLSPFPSLLTYSFFSLLPLLSCYSNHTPVILFHVFFHQHVPFASFTNTSSSFLLFFLQSEAGF